MTLALLCSGQGQQHAGMFDITAPEPAAASLFARATTLLGADPRAVAADPDRRTENRAGQILCTLQAVAAFAALGPWPARLLVAGYSVGELAAWSLAGAVAPEIVLDLAARRAALMDAAGTPGDGLLFVRGLTRTIVDALCATHATAVAIVNPDDAFVLGGPAEGLTALAIDAGRRGATRVQPLAVRVASHTPRLAGASVAFAAALAEQPLGRPRPGTRLFSGIDAAPVLDVAAGRNKLAAQIATTVQWAACLEACVEAGATAFLELGPGHALSGMATQAYPAIPARSLDQFHTLEGVRAWLARAG